jgi:hypothetical protein
MICGLASSTSQSCSYVEAVSPRPNTVRPRVRYHIAAPLAEESVSSQYKSQNGDSPNDSGRDIGVQVTQVVSPDSTLTAFCQLAAIRLGVQRCGISLISRYQQYILAESTRTTNLSDTTQSDDPEDSLWLGMCEVSPGPSTLSYFLSSYFKSVNGMGISARIQWLCHRRLVPKYRHASQYQIFETAPFRKRHMSTALHSCDFIAVHLFLPTKAIILAAFGFSITDFCQNSARIKSNALGKSSLCVLHLVPTNCQYQLHCFPCYEAISHGKGEL